MDKTGTHAIDFLKSLGSVDTVLAEAGNASLPDSLTYNSHIHLPPNFSAFETFSKPCRSPLTRGFRF